MDQVTEFFKGLFATDLWPPRWHCGTWTSFHGWMYIIGDLLTWLAYFLIPFIIIRFVMKKKELEFHKIYYLFAAFILWCGTTHFLDAMAFWIPAYRLNALVRFFTGTISIVTVFYLIRILPVAFSIRTRLQLEKTSFELEERNRQLGKVNTELEEFAFAFSHDLKEPLRKMQVFLNLVFQNDCLSEKDKLYVDKAYLSARRMNALITDVLDYAKASSEETGYEKVDLNEIMEGVAADFELQIEDKAAKVEFADLPTIEGRKHQLHQLFSNLVGNALKFSAGQPVVTIRYERIPRQEAEALGFPGNEYVKLVVKDNGVGFDQTYSEQIFRMFQRLYTKDEFEGTGIGLALCKKIVENHKGFISARSEVGKGAEFLVILPVKQG